MPDMPTLHQLAMLRFNPEPIVVHKPRPTGDGVALKLDLRVTPVFNAKGFVEDAEGGVFLELAPQAGKTADGKFPTFGWTPEQTIAAKLGLADLCNMLSSIDGVRRGTSFVAPALRLKTPPKTDLGSSTAEQRRSRTLSLFHKFGTTSTAINWEFVVDENPRSLLAVSKSAEKRGSIALTLAEELLVERYLSNALDAFIAVGLR